MNDFYDYLVKNGFLIDNITYQTIKTAIALRLPILLSGRPGVGKTQLTKLVADYLGAEYLFFQCVQGTDSDDLIWRMVPSEKTKSGIKLIDGVLLEAVKKSVRGKVVLVLDEFDKTRPNADALLLDFLQNCRVSVRIDDEDTVITGNAQNLWVFLTSNNEREFSEPLMRRLVHIKLPLLSSKQVESILKSKGFSEEAIKLAVQIYRDTINAGLNKVATIQELQQFCAAYDSNPEADFTSLVYSFVIKNDEDFERYAEYKKSGSYSDGDSEAQYEDLSPYYEEQQEQEEEEKRGEREERKPTRPRVKTVKPADFQKPNSDDSEVTALIPNKDSKGYTMLVKTFLPEPSDNPANIGKFTVLSNDVIVTKDQLTLDEAMSLIKNNSTGDEIELYYEDFVYFINKKYFYELVRKANKIYCYSKHRLALSTKSSGEEIMELEFLNPIVARIKCYFRGRNEYGTLSDYIATEDLNNLREVLRGLSGEKASLEMVEKYIKIASWVAQSPVITSATINVDDFISCELKMSCSSSTSVAVILGGNLAKFVKQKTGRDTFDISESSSVLELVKEYYRR